jgi:chitin disaccharide deacetylase
MLIVNADDWGRSQGETEAALTCYRKERITSVSAMVFMGDSRRAARLAKDSGIEVGLHLNLSQVFTGECPVGLLRVYQDRIVRFLTLSKYSLLLYNPLLRREFRYLFEAQIEEFARLYGKQPSHIDGHQHMHLCSNMLLDRVIPEGVRVRRSFSFGPGEKNAVNRAYRHLVDLWLARRHRITDYFFSLSQCLQNNRLTYAVEAAESATVELMTHPTNQKEYSHLMSEDHVEMLGRVGRGTYALV